jgi:hypothetical protein
MLSHQPFQTKSTKTLCFVHLKTSWMVLQVNITGGAETLRKSQVLSKLISRVLFKDLDVRCFSKMRGTPLILFYLRILTTSVMIVFIKRTVLFKHNHDKRRLFGNLVVNHKIDIYSRMK